MNNCLYYQAQVQKSNTWFLTACLRSFEHLVFDRTIDKQTGTFEFFVPQKLENYFLEIMNHFEKQGIVTNLHKLSNRLS